MAEKILMAVGLVLVAVILTIDASTVRLWEDAEQDADQERAA